MTGTLGILLAYYLAVVYAMLIEQVVPPIELTP